MGVYSSNETVDTNYYYDLVIKNQMPEHKLEKGDIVLFASVGAGMKWNKLTLDGSLTGLTSTGTATQRIDGTDLLTQVGVTYMF